MAKHKLDLDDLKVESFETLSHRTLGGVYGHQSIDPTCQIAPTTIDTGCPTDSAEHCGPQPVWTCGTTCLGGSGCDTLGSGTTCMNADPPCPV